MVARNRTHTAQLDWVKRMVADIDRSELVSPHLVISPVLGAISPDRLSGGAKTLILIAHDQHHVFNASICGDNCASWLLRIGMEQDVLVRLGHLMHFVDEPFEIRIATPILPPNTTAVATNAITIIAIVFTPLFCS
jgi:hypothetical protein